MQPNSSALKFFTVGTGALAVLTAQASCDDPRIPCDGDAECLAEEACREEACVGQAFKAPSVDSDDEEPESGEFLAPAPLSTRTLTLGETLSGSVGPNKYWYAELNKLANRRYTVCVEVSKGDADLYGHWSGLPTTTSYQKTPFVAKSSNGGTQPDCFAIDSTTNGPYYIGVHGYAANVTSEFKLWFVSSGNSVPADLVGKLKRPNGCTSYTHQLYGPFNSPWGNEVKHPFYAGVTGFLHNGTDFACAPDTTVRAVCDGVVKYTSGNCTLDPQWGFCVVQECKLGSTTITVAYDHLKDAGRAPAGPITAGTKIGTIFDVASQVSGEKNHLHLGICLGGADSCFGVAKAGAVTRANFPGPMINSNAPSLWAP